MDSLLKASTEASLLLFQIPLYLRSRGVIRSGYLHLIWYMIFTFNISCKTKWAIDQQQSQQAHHWLSSPRTSIRETCLFFWNLTSRWGLGSSSRGDQKLSPPISPRTLTGGLSRREVEAERLNTPARRRSSVSRLVSAWASTLHALGITNYQMLMQYTILIYFMLQERLCHVLLNSGKKKRSDPMKDKQASNVCLTANLLNMRTCVSFQPSELRLSGGYR